MELRWRQHKRSSI